MEMISGEIDFTKTNIDGSPVKENHQIIDKFINQKRSIIARFARIDSMFDVELYNAVVDTYKQAFEILYEFDESDRLSDPYIDQLISIIYSRRYLKAVYTILSSSAYTDIDLYKAINSAFYTRYRSGYYFNSDNESEWVSIINITSRSIFDILIKYTQDVNFAMAASTAFLSVDDVTKKLRRFFSVCYLYGKDNQFMYKEVIETLSLTDLYDTTAICCISEFLYRKMNEINVSKGIKVYPAIINGLFKRLEELPISTIEQIITKASVIISNYNIKFTFIVYRDMVSYPKIANAIKNLLLRDAYII